MTAVRVWVTARHETWLEKQGVMYRTACTVCDWKSRWFDDGMSAEVSGHAHRQRHPRTWGTRVELA